MQTTPPISLGTLQWPEHTDTIPALPGVFCLEVNGRVTYLSSAPNLRRRVERLAKKLKLAEHGQAQASVIMHCWPSESKLQTALLLYDLARQHFPDEYLQRTHLRMPWFVTLLNRDPFPRLHTGNRLPTGADLVVGPFARRELAQLYVQQVESAFLLRRCTETLDPSPQHPGCIYGEMKQCLRPCQCAVDESEYRAEAVAVYTFLQENGSRTVREKAKSREAAIEAMDFERAAQIHKQIEKLEAARDARSPVVSNVYHLHGVALVPAQISGGLQVYPLVGACWQGPVSVSAEETALQGRELEALLRSRLNFAGLEEQPAQRDRLEDMALFVRWVYSSWREGEWLAVTDVNEPPYRKMARAVTRMAAKLLIP